MTLTTLPPTILIQISQYLTAQSLLALACTTKQLYKLLAHNQMIWAELYRKTFSKSMSSMSLVERVTATSPCNNASGNSNQPIGRTRSIRKSISQKFTHNRNKASISRQRAEEMIHVEREREQDFHSRYPFFPMIDMQIEPPPAVDSPVTADECRFRKAWSINQGWMHGKYKLKRGRGKVSMIQFLPNSEQIIAAHSTGKIKIWDPNSPKKSFRSIKISEQPISVFSILHEQNKTLLVCADVATPDLYIYDYSTGDHLQTIRTEHSDTITCLAWEILADNSYRIYSGSEDKSMQVFELDPAQLIQTMAYLSCAPLSITTVPDSLAITTDTSGYIKVYSTKNWDCLRVFHLYPVGLRGVQIVVDQSQCDFSELPTSVDPHSPATPLKGLKVKINAVTTAGQVLEFCPAMIAAPSDDQTPFESTVSRHEQALEELELSPLSQPVLETILSPTILNRSRTLPMPNPLHAVFVPDAGTCGPYLHLVYTQTPGNHGDKSGLDASESGIFVMGHGSLYEVSGKRKFWSVVGPVTRIAVFGEWLVAAGRDGQWGILQFGGAFEPKKGWRRFFHRTV